MTTTTASQLWLTLALWHTSRGGGEMDPVSVSLAEKIIMSVGRPVARWVWQKVRTPPEVEAFLRVSARAMAESAIFVKQIMIRRQKRTHQYANGIRKPPGFLCTCLTSALDLEDLVGRLFIDAIETGINPDVEDLPMMIINRFCENGGDPGTAVIPVLEVAERFVMVLPRLLAREAARPGQSAGRLCHYQLA